MFGRRQSESPAAAASTAAAHELDEADGPGKGKGRPTPKRREAEKSRRQRATVPTDRREAARLMRQRRREERDATRQALLNGDESRLPARDRGPVRRLVRDTVDGRRSAGEYFLYVAFAMLGLSLVQAEVVQIFGTLILFMVIGIVIVDTFLIRRRLKAVLQARGFSPEETRGAVAYGLIRSLQTRRLRLPKPMVSPGRTRESKSSA